MCKHTRFEQGIIRGAQGREQCPLTFFGVRGRHEQTEGPFSLRRHSYQKQKMGLKHRLLRANALRDAGQYDRALEDYVTVHKVGTVPARRKNFRAQVFKPPPLGRALAACVIVIAIESERGAESPYLARAPHHGTF
jgi:hypothetical protein